MAKKNVILAAQLEILTIVGEALYVRDKAVDKAEKELVEKLRKVREGLNLSARSSEVK